MTAQRDDRGRFLPGNSGGPGRPSREVEAEYLLELRAGVPIERWRKVVKRAVGDAIDGCDKARQWLGKYVLPDPTKTLEISGPDGGPIESTVNGGDLYQFYRGVIEGETEGSDES